MLMKKCALIRKVHLTRVYGSLNGKRDKEGKREEVHVHGWGNKDRGREREKLVAVQHMVQYSKRECGWEREINVPAYLNLQQLYHLDNCRDK